MKCLDISLKYLSCGAAWTWPEAPGFYIRDTTVIECWPEEANFPRTFFFTITSLATHCLSHHYKHFFLDFKSFYELAPNYWPNPTFHLIPNSTSSTTKFARDCLSHIFHSYLGIFTHIVTPFLECTCPPLPQISMRAHSFSRAYFMFYLFQKALLGYSGPHCLLNSWPLLANFTSKPHV